MLSRHFGSVGLCVIRIVYFEFWCLSSVRRAGEIECLVFGRIDSLLYSNTSSSTVRQATQVKAQRETSWHRRMLAKCTCRAVVGKRKWSVASKLEKPGSSYLAQGLQLTSSSVAELGFFSLFAWIIVYCIRLIEQPRLVSLVSHSIHLPQATAYQLPMQSHSLGRERERETFSTTTHSQLVRESKSKVES